METAAPIETAEEPVPALQEETTVADEPAISEETPSAPQQEPAPQPPVEQSAPVQQDSAPANNSDSNNGSSGSDSGTYSDGSISHNGTVIVNGKTKTGVRVFASVSDLDGVTPIKTNEIVSVNGVPYVWTFTEWADYSGFSTEVIYHNEGELSGELVVY